MELVNRNSSLLSKYGNKEDIVFINKNDKETLLLLEQPKKDLNILKTIGLDYHINNVEAELHVKNSKKQIGILFGKPSFLGSDIKKLCNEYDLTISKAVNYKGAPFEGLPQIMKDFIEEHSYDKIISEAVFETKQKPLKYSNHKPVLDEFGNQVYEDYEVEIESAKSIRKSKIKTGYANWFIMAPRESFDGTTKNNCCTLFYRDNDDTRFIEENDVFVEIASWGKSYSDLRKYNYFLKYIDFNKEGVKRDNNDLMDGVSQSIGFYLSLISVLALSIFYIYSFNVICVIQTLILLFMFFNIRKSSSDYLKLWKM